VKPGLNAFICVLCVVSMVLPAAALAADLAGKWNFVLDTEGGERRAAAEFRVEGEKVTGKWGDGQGSGTFVEGKLEFSVAIESEVGPGTLKLSGKIQGNELSGNWQFQSYSGTFKAVRPE